VDPCFSRLNSEYHDRIAERGAATPFLAQCFEPVSKCTAFAGPIGSTVSIELCAVHLLWADMFYCVKHQQERSFFVQTNWWTSTIFKFPEIIDFIMYLFIQYTINPLISYDKSHYFLSGLNLYAVYSRIYRWDLGGGLGLIKNESLQQDMIWVSQCLN
jgi:hypothetical protein